MIDSSPVIFQTDQFIVLQFPVLKDNYNFIIHNTKTSETLAVDPSDSTVTKMHLHARGWDLHHIVLTHHHDDHIGGVNELVRLFKAKVWGPSRVRELGVELNLALSGGEVITLLGTPIKVIATPGHTIDHLVYYFTAMNWLFCGDTLFRYGCGRLFEGKPSEMWASLNRIAQLPDQTLTFCAHEYTLTNLKFALSLSPDDAHLQSALQSTLEKMSLKEPTVPFLLSEQKQFNPFMNPLRFDSKGNPSIAKNAEDLFATFREMRNRFVSN